jgi:ribosome recycling factor
LEELAAPEGAAFPFLVDRFGKFLYNNSIVKERQGGLNMYQDAIQAAGEKMEKTVAIIVKDLSTLRAGRANPQILDKIAVDYYGTPTPLNQVGNISSPEPRMLVIAPWEPKMIGPIEKAIQKSDLGINPSNDGKVVRLMVPELTEERRRDLCKQVKKMVEDGKIAVRNTRRDTMEHIKKMKKNSEITEDDLKDAEEEMNKSTEAHIKDLDKIGTDKEKEIMSI